MKKHLCRALLALTLALAVTGTTLPTAWAAESEENAPLDCASALLMEAESGRVLFEYNADDRHAPASITKIMTMLLVCEAVDAGLADEIMFVDGAPGALEPAAAGAMKAQARSLINRAPVLPRELIDRLKAEQKAKEDAEETEKARVVLQIERARF